MYKPLPDYLTIQPSKVEGLGLFAIKDIPAYEVIGMTHAKWYGEPNNLLRTPLGGFINHSDTPTDRDWETNLTLLPYLVE